MVEPGNVNSNPALLTPGSVLTLLFYRSREERVGILMRAMKIVPKGILVKAAPLKIQDTISRTL